MKKILFNVCIIFLFVGCSPKLREGVIGWWVIEEIKYADSDILETLTGNLIIFEDTHHSKFPDIVLNKNANYPTTLVWRESVTTDGSFEVSISGDNEIFSGRYHVTFEKDMQRKYFIMKMKSDKLYLKCAKGLFSFDQSQGLMNNLVK